MNVRIRTAHGYLSFQPDGRIEYRDRAAGWETLDIEGLTIEPVPGPGPSPITPPPSGDVGEPTAQYVGRVKERLMAAGISLAGACGAFEITKRVAWDLRHLGYGLLAKPGGNNCDGFATDVIVCPNRVDIVDLLGDGGGRNDPSWQVKPNEVDPSRWRAPIAP